MYQEQVQRLTRVADEIEEATARAIKKAEALATTTKRLADTVAQLRAEVNENWRVIANQR